MIDHPPAADPPAWQQIHDLTRRLLAEPAADAQTQLITTTAHRLVDGRADVWFVEENTPPPTDLMDQSLESGSSRVLSPGGEARDGTAVAVPLLAGETVLGVLQVSRPEGPPFDTREVDLLESLAGQAAVTLENARLRASHQTQDRDLSTVARVGRAVVSILDLDALLDRIVDVIQEEFGYPFVHLLTVDPARQRIVYRAGSGPRGQALQQEGLVCKLDDPQHIVSWVACHGETEMMNDLGAEARYRPSQFSEVDVRSEIAIPLTFGDKVLGILDVQSDRPRAFEKQDRLLLETLADTVAIAIRNANLYRSERWRRQVADGMREVAGLLSAEAALDDVLEAILTELERNLPCDASAVWLLDGGTLCLSAAHGEAADTCFLESPEDGNEWLQQALRADSPLIRTPDSPPEPLGISQGLPADYSAIAAPLRAGDRRLGVLTLVHHTPGRYGSESQAMTAAFASYAAVAIENTRLYQETQELARISTVMLKVAEVTRSLSSLETVIGTVIDLLPSLVGINRCAILLWDESTATFVPAGARGIIPEQEEVFSNWRVTPSQDPIFDTLRTDKTPIFIYDVATDDRTSGSTLWELGFDTLLLLPLMAQGDVLGALLVDYGEAWGPSSRAGIRYDERLPIIQGLTLQTAAAIETTRLRESQQEEAYVSTALLQVAQAVANLNDVDDILSTIVRITPILVGVERCVVYLWDDEHGAFYATQSYGVPRELVEDHLVARRWRGGEMGLLDAARERNDVIVHTPPSPVEEQENLIPSGFAGDHLGYTLETGHRSLLAIPLSVKGDVLGVMVIGQSRSSPQLRQRRLEILTGIAQQAAIAVQNDRLQQEKTERERLERELQLAHDIQETFMPAQAPVLSGWELAFSWRAARQVAGDFYDFFELPGGKLGLVIADVADKGMPAALFMALTRTLMRAAALEEPSPAATLARANDLLVPDAHSGMFVTLFYAVLDLETGQLDYANGGHNRPVLLRAGTAEPVLLAKGEMALGVLEGIRHEEHAITLAPGDTVFLYTDGITEAFSEAGEMYGDDRLHRTLRAVAGGSARQVLETVEESVVRFVGEADISDDRTSMVLRRVEG